MSKKLRGEKRGKADPETETVEEETSTKKEKLLLEIKALRLLICRIESNVKPISFKSICKEQFGDMVKTTKGNYGELVDVQVEWQNDLYAYAGLCCTKIGQEIVFAFQSFEKDDVAANSHWIKLVNIEESWQLRQWVMPISIDVKAVFAKYPINSSGSMKLFLRECKHLIDCYNCRKNEFQELEAFSENLNGSVCTVVTNYGYTQTTIKLARARCASPDEGRNVLVYLVYRASEARPSKLLIDGDGEKKVSDDETKYFRALFRSLKERDPKDALEKILATNGNSFVGNEEDNSANDTIEAEEEEVEKDLSKILKVKTKAVKKRDKVAIERDENANEVNEDDGGRENDLSIDAVDRSNVRSSSGEDVATKKGKKSRKKRTSRKKVNTKGASTSKTHRAGKNTLPSTDRNDNVPNINLVGQNDKDIRSIVPEMFKPRAKESGGAAAQKSLNEVVENPKRDSKIENNAGKVSTKAGDSFKKSVKQSHRQLMCSTPIAGRTLLLSKVAEENISAIDRENGTIAKGVTATGITERPNLADRRDGSDTEESDGQDATRMEKSQMELLNQLRAVKEKVVAPKKSAKRKAKSPAKGKKKIARK